MTLISAILIMSRTISEKHSNRDGNSPKEFHYKGNYLYRVMLLTKVCVMKAMVFPIVTYGCQSWTIKKAECRRIDAFKLWCWRRLLRVPWTARRSSQSTLNEINPEYSVEGLMVKPKLQSFGHLILRADSLEKILILGKTEDGRGGQQKMKWLRNITDSVDRNLGKL